MRHRDRQVCRHARNVQEGLRAHRLASAGRVTKAAAGGNRLQERLRPLG